MSVPLRSIHAGQQIGSGAAVDRRARAGRTRTPSATLTASPGSGASGRINDFQTPTSSSTRRGSGIWTSTAAAYYKPHPGEDLRTAHVELPVLEALVEARGRKSWRSDPPLPRADLRLRHLAGAEHGQRLRVRPGRLSPGGRRPPAEHDRPRPPRRRHPGQRLDPVAHGSSSSTTASGTWERWA